jgi:hypothetical protein
LEGVAKRNPVTSAQWPTIVCIPVPVELKQVYGPQLTGARTDFGWKMRKSSPLLLEVFQQKGQLIHLGRKRLSITAIRRLMATHHHKADSMYKITFRT